MTADPTHDCPACSNAAAIWAAAKAAAERDEPRPCLSCGNEWDADLEPSPGEADGICPRCWEAAHPHRCDCQTCLDIADDAAEERSMRDHREAS